ncbi:ATP-dependent DNA helicase RecG [Frankia casuarinae]|uniref:Probable DNA 3'-5' helicase RecG n=1 Tax=Frankia casuarinae (strain DSM 45818 / CECT 9043 / HFP020203 / CcI3) TaxID=106370 RepID=Q2J6Y3_FRACC|nr:ATP-dependent DNA helicase RecG [Frankia casuarinae]EYT93485.1 ATP-dependent DNA helicase RecG [Frankia casuarinae]
MLRCTIGDVVDLDTPLKALVGARAAALLADGLELRLVGDLLGHLPRRYHERGELTDLADLVVGETVTVQARVEKTERRPMRGTRKSMVRVTVTDGRHSLSLTFFNQSWRERDLRPGTTALFAGKVDEFRGQRQLTNPEVQLLEPEESGEAVSGAPFANALVPIYPASAKVPSWTLARCVRLALDSLDPVEDPLPDDLRSRYRLPALAEAFRLVHQPANRGEIASGRRRLTWDEALVLQVALAQRRREVEALATTPRPQRPDGLLAAFDADLPFPLTTGQREVGKTIAAEIGRPVPMHRLLQGEVGSGKTLVALRAMLTVVDTGGQAVLLAPTETLAAQHSRSLREMLGDLARAGELGADHRATRVTLVTGSMGGRARREALAEIADGSTGLVVGTHALLHDEVIFNDLGLIVVDEQHRFGVEQRDALRARGRRPPHLLVMTATPIPRTVAMTVFGDLEVSELTELPAGRSPIGTFVVPASQRSWTDRMWGRIRDEVAAGHQAYVVCPRIGAGGEDGGGEDDPAESSAAGPDSRASRPAATVCEVLPLLVDGEFADLRVEPLHGRLAPGQREATMNRFAAGEVDVLVATTVIEVGVNVPNATVMVVLDADRFGVSQLHQLRGRVGRGTAPGWCLLHTAAEPGSPAWERLSAVAATSDGAKLARLDLAQRREGDVLGAAQSGGRRSLKLLELLRDEDLIRDAREEAGRLVDDDPGLDRHPALRRLLDAVLDDTSVAFLEKG